MHKNSPPPQTLPTRDGATREACITKVADPLDPEFLRLWNALETPMAEVRRALIAGNKLLLETKIKQALDCVTAARRGQFIALEETPLGELAELDPRDLDTLDRHGIRTIGALLQQSDKDLLAIPNFGPVTVHDILTALAKHCVREHRQMSARLASQQAIVGRAIGKRAAAAQ